MQIYASEVIIKQIFVVAIASFVVLSLVADRRYDPTDSGCYVIRVWELKLWRIEDLQIEALQIGGPMKESDVNKSVKTVFFFLYSFHEMVQHQKGCISLRAILEWKNELFY